MNSEQILKFLVEIVKEASALVTDKFEVNRKGDASDLITNLDVEIEEFLISKINARYPDFSIVSEEKNPQQRSHRKLFRNRSDRRYYKFC